MKRTRDIFLFTCCLIVAIRPLNLMQVVAWGNMLHSYSEDKTLAEAAEMTFSGKHPCEMCRRIAETKARDTQESPSDQPAPLPQEERNTLRLIFQCDDHSGPAPPRWVVQVSSLPGDVEFHAPLPRFQRVPTPPPQLG